MMAPAPAHQLERTMHLAIQDRTRELARAVQRRSLPQQHPGNRQLRMHAIAVPADRIGKSISCACHRGHSLIGEATAGISKVLGPPTESALDLGLRTGRLFGEARQSFISHQDMTSGM